jgi:glutamate--cysteine ligase
MPALRPELDAHAARSVAAEAFLPAGRGLWGVEAERIVYRTDDPAVRVPPAELRLAGGPLPRSGRVTLEPGGQVEISTAPATDLDEVLDALQADIAELDRRLARAGLRAADCPLDAERPPQRVLTLPRYRAMEAFFDSAGPAGRWMMCNTAAVQVNLSHDPADPSRRWRVMHAIAPVLLAVFANSPGVDCGGRSWASLRQGIWSALDPGRTQAPDPAVPAARAWADYVLAADVMMIRVADEAVDVGPGLSFACWVRDGHPVGWPTADDLRYHMTTLFPPIRPRGWLEIRVIDALPPQVREIAVLIVAAAAQPQAAAALLRLLPDTTSWWLPAARLGLAHGGLAAAADALFEIADQTLPLVTHRPSRITAVREYRNSHVRHRRQPWDGVMDPLPGRTRVPDLGHRRLLGVGC